MIIIIKKQTYSIDIIVNVNDRLTHKQKEGERQKMQRKKILNFLLLLYFFVSFIFFFV